MRYKAGANPSHPHQKVQGHQKFEGQQNESKTHSTLQTTQDGRGSIRSQQSQDSPAAEAAQMQLHSRARVTSGALEGLLKVTRHKLCESSRFSTLSSLVSITHPGIRLSARYDFYRAL